MANDGKAPAAAGALPATCPVEKCTAKPKRAGFCTEHFTWFKEGLVNRKGQKPSDFDKKYQAFTHRKKAV